jgi:hypothetical protein
MKAVDGVEPEGRHETVELKTSSEQTRNTSSPTVLQDRSHNEQVASISKGRLYILVIALGITNLAIALDGSVLGEFDHCGQWSIPEAQFDAD